MDRATARARLSLAGDALASARDQLDETMEQVREAIRNGASVGLSDPEMAKLTGLNRNTVNPVSKPYRDAGKV